MFAEIIAIQRALRWLQATRRCKKSMMIADGMRVLRRLNGPAEIADLLDVRKQSSGYKCSGRPAD